MKEFLRKNYMLIIMFAVIFNVMAVGVTIAYFTSKPDSVTNSFNAGNVTITVTEPNWDPTPAKNVAPNEEIEKDPKITNTGKFDAYVFMKVEVDRANVKVVESDKVTITQKLIDLFTFETNENWEQVEKTTDNEKTTYIYAYTKEILKTGKTTNSLFDKVKMANVLEGQLSTTSTYHVNATGLAIQSDSMELVGETMIEKMTYAYNTYLKG